MSHVTCSRTSCQSSLPFCTTYQAITQLAGQLVVPQRSLNHYISFDIDPTDRVPAIVYDHPTLLVRRPHFRCPTRVWDHFSSSPPREKFPTRSSVARPPSLILTSSHILWNAAAPCSYSTRPPRLWTIALPFVCSDLLDNLLQRITSQLDAVHFFPMLFFCLNYGQRWWYGWHWCILHTLIRHRIRRCPTDILGLCARTLIRRLFFCLKLGIMILHKRCTSRPGRGISRLIYATTVILLYICLEMPLSVHQSVFSCELGRHSVLTCSIKNW